MSVGADGKPRARKPQSLCVSTVLWDRSSVARLCIGRGVDPMCQGSRCIVERHLPVFATAREAEMHNDYQLQSHAGSFPLCRTWPLSCRLGDVDSLNRKPGQATFCMCVPHSPSPMPSAIQQALHQHEPARAALCLRGLTAKCAHVSHNRCVF